MIATSALVLAAIYVLWLYQRMMTGPVARGSEGIRDLAPRELVVVVPLIGALIFFGVYPKPVLEFIDPAVTQTLTIIGSVDPPPSVPAQPEAANPGGAR